MTFQQTIEVLFPYLFSIRKLKNYLSIDLVFPSSWEFPNNIVEKLQVTQNEGNNNQLVTSFVCQPNNMDTTLSGIYNLVHFNLEREEKEKLFKNKVTELKKLFGNTTLEQLKGLKFDIEDEEDTELYGGDDTEDSTS